MMTILSNVSRRISRLARLGLFAVLLLGAAIPASGQAREVTLEELTAASSDVVLGAVSQKQSFWNDARTRIYTEVRLQVTERVKGEAADETVLVIPGGQVGNTLYDVSDMPVFIEGEEVVVFLWRNPSGEHTVAGASQGKLRVMRDESGVRVLEPGAARLFARETVDAEKSDSPSRLERRPVPLDEFVRAVKRVERN